jgi:hypothetical protein
VKRRLFNLLAGISLILFVAMAALWIRSYSKADDFIYFGRSGGGGLHDAKGRIALIFDNAMWSNPHFEYHCRPPAPPP